MNGHVVKAWATPAGDGSYITGPSWNWCERCSEGPSSVDLKRMFDEVDSQARASGVQQSVEKARWVSAVGSLVGETDDVKSVDWLIDLLKRKRADLVARDDDLRRRDGHLKINRRVLAEAGLVGRTEDDLCEVFAAVSDRVLEVYDLLDTCDRRLERAAVRQDGEAAPSGVQSLLGDACSGLESLAGEGVSCEYGIYVNGSRHSLGSVRRRFEELTHTVEALSAGPGH